MVTIKNPFLIFVRNLLLPLVAKTLLRSIKIKTILFRFVSQLSIRYHENAFVREVVEGADEVFLRSLPAGSRAPDAPFKSGTLFAAFKEKPINVLIFGSGSDQALVALESDLIKVHRVQRSVESERAFSLYGVKSEAIYVIRPDGYIGFRSIGAQANSLKTYLRDLTGF